MGFSSSACLLAAAVMLSTPAPSLGGEWCENFESGPGTFWTQTDWQGGRWQHASYTNETKMGHRMPQPRTGEDGVMMLRGDGETLAFWSMLVSPEMEFTEEASVQLVYWLSLGSAPSNPVSFMVFRRVDGVDDSAPLLDITNYVTGGDGNGWMSMEVGLSRERGSRMQIAIYGYLAGDGPAVDSNIALDRITLRGVTENNACGERSPVPVLPTSEPQAIPTVAPPDAPNHPKYDFFCPKRYGLFLDPSDCGFFYSCNNWEAIHMACPSQLVYSQPAKACLFKWQVPEC